MTSTAAARFRVHGRVQGVSFRYRTRQLAERLGLCGWVCNREDGSVEGEASGSVAALEELRGWLERGPPPARVERVEWVTAVDAEPATGFLIR